MNARSGPSVSVVVPAHNAARFLGEALDSILAQTSGRMEIVVVDDGSTDATGAVARGYADRGTLCVPVPERRGIGAARNLGIRTATGDYLAFLDADDLWTPTRTAVLAAALTAAAKPSIAVGRVEQFLCPSLSPEQRAQYRVPPEAPAYLAGGVLVRRADFLAVGAFDESLTLGEFVDWFGRARQAGLGEIQVADVVLRRRIHGANHTLRHRVSARDYLEVARRELARKREAISKS